MRKLRAATRKPVVVQPVFPNVGVQVWYQSELDSLVNASANELLNDITHTWNKNPPLLVVIDEALAADASSPTKALQAALYRWGQQTIKRFDLVAQMIANDFATRSMRATQTSMMSQLKKAGFTVAFKPTLKSMEAYRAVTAENVALIKSIPRKWQEQVEQKVYNAIRNGSDLHTLSVDLRKSYGITTRRAALIAIDQNAKAKAVIERVRRQELGITRAIWMHSNAGKEPRPSHIGPTMNGKPYNISKGMWDKDEGKYVWPGELIRCRCTDRAVIEGAEDDEDDNQPTSVMLEAALRNAQQYAGKARGGEMVGILRTLYLAKHTWTKGENTLRYSIDRFLRGE